jgi:endonuclease YncB( thermonuclease family)
MWFCEPRGGVAICFDRAEDLNGQMVKNVWAVAYRKRAAWSMR